MNSCIGWSEAATVAFAPVFEEFGLWFWTPWFSSWMYLGQTDNCNYPINPLACNARYTSHSVMLQIPASGLGASS
jgi:hypothetical protein